MVHSSLRPWAGWAVPCGLDLRRERSLQLLTAGGQHTGAACPDGPLPTTQLAFTSELHEDSHLGTPGNIPNLHSQSLQVSIWKIPGRPRLGFPCITRIRDQVKLSEVPSMPRAPQAGMTIHAIRVLWGHCTLQPGHPSHVPAEFWSPVYVETHPQCVERERRGHCLGSRVSGAIS